MGGSNKMSTQKELLHQRQKLLDEYEKSIGLPDHTPPGEENELQQYLHMTRNQIEALDSATAFSISARLSQFAFYFQRAINREKSNKIWAEAQLARIVCKEALQYDKYTPNKTELVCRENVAAYELKQIAIYAEQRIARIEEISSGLRNLSYVLSMVAKSKMGENNV